jgi:hypothetical protein
VILRIDEIDFWQRPLSTRRRASTTSSISAKVVVEKRLSFEMMLQKGGLPKTWTKVLQLILHFIVINITLTLMQGHCNKAPCDLPTPSAFIQNCQNVLQQFIAEGRIAKFMTPVVDDLNLNRYLVAINWKSWKHRFSSSSRVIQAT